MTYDKAVYALAADFLGDRPHIDTETARADLAKTIQKAIEDFIGHRETLARRGIDIEFHRDFYRF